MKAEPTKDEKFMERRGKRIADNLGLRQHETAIVEFKKDLRKYGLKAKNPVFDNAIEQATRNLFRETQKGLVTREELTNAQKDLDRNWITINKKEVKQAQQKTALAIIKDLEWMIIRNLDDESTFKIQKVSFEELKKKHLSETEVKPR